MTSVYGPGDRNINRTPYMDLNQSRDNLYIHSNPTQDPFSSSLTQSAPQTYPPPHNEYNPSYYASNAALKDDFPGREHGRTPSPTPSEAEELMRKTVIDWKKMSSWRFWFRREWLWYYVALTVILIVVALIAIYDKQIVGWLEPDGRKIRALPAGFLIPIAIFFVISFPPLFGQEILAILCGLVWGLWIGFAIVAAGTYLGELGNFFAFKYCCRSRGEKLEKSKITYACLAKIVREGGFKIALIARYSAIPGHFTTAIFSTCGMSVFVFSAAAILSLPKQFITVYVGVVLDQAGNGTADTKNKIIEDVVLVITIIITGLAMWYIYKKMNEVKPEVIYERRKARQRKREANSPTPSVNHPYQQKPFRGDVFNPANSDSTLPLNSVQHQQWDEYGRAVGYVGDPRFENPGDVSRNRIPTGNIYSPTPVAPGRVPTFGTGDGGRSRADDRRYSPASSGTPVLRGTDYERVNIGAAESDVGDRTRPYRFNRGEDRREESVDSVGWELQSGGVAGSEAYRMPVIGSSVERSQGQDVMDEDVTPRNSTSYSERQQRGYHDPYQHQYQTQTQPQAPTQTYLSQSSSYPPPLNPPSQQQQQYILPLGPPPQQQVQHTPPIFNKLSSPKPISSLNQPLQSPFESSQLDAPTQFHPDQTQGHQLFPSSSSTTSNSSYYTAAPEGIHSRMGTEDPLLNNSPLNRNTTTASSGSSLPSPPFRQQMFSPPPPSYHSTAPP